MTEEDGMTTDEPVGAFAMRLSRLMRERGFNQSTLSRLLDLGRSQTVYRWVNAKSEPSYIMLRRLKSVLGCTYEELFEG